jgi:hypothetical protein
MKANELRIGNWVQTDKGRQYQIDLSWYECCKDSTEGRDIQLDTHPIPLTEEWLVKFGINNVSQTNWIYYQTKIGYYNITIENGVFKFWLADCDDCGYSIDIISVHQLQNLYFALTGEELTIL